jgi:hypothetical protein
MQEARDLWLPDSDREIEIVPAVALACRGGLRKCAQRISKRATETEQQTGPKEQLERHINPPYHCHRYLRSAGKKTRMHFEETWLRNGA